MKFITFQPESVLTKLQRGEEFKSDCINDFSECSAENIALKNAVGFSPIWCIPLYDDLYSLYNVLRCSPSFPQVAIVFEKNSKDTKNVRFIDYAKYSECVRNSKIDPDLKIDFKKCVAPRNNAEYFKKRSAYYECVVSNIQAKEVRGSAKISDSQSPVVLNHTLFFFDTSEKLQELLGTHHKLIVPEDNVLNSNLRTAWEALRWHKLVDYCMITEDTIACSVRQFMEQCVDQ